MGDQVEAAGGVVWRSRGGDLEVLLVHRPKYDDWSLPKGKLDAGESHEQAARREVLEETGLACSLGAELIESRYKDGKGRPKRVRYWAMRPDAGSFEVNQEVDEVRWLTPAKAAQLLTYGRDRPVLDSFNRLSKRERKP